ncbi:receptor-like protein 33 [Rosa chinensis]|uniref:receptor-like protein 33 n=1 Tax=Rosa chinensis TaxID=74649 RepID=UPI000D0958B7|nr:receptor-like protein 33 [Rosa chinensis]
MEERAGGLAMFAEPCFEWCDLDLTWSMPARRHTAVVGSSDCGSKTVLGVSGGSIGRDGLHSPLRSDDDFGVYMNCNRHFAATWSNHVTVGCQGGYYRDTPKDVTAAVEVAVLTNGSVLGLDISSESISGGIDNSSSLFHLQHLQSLNLADNELGNGLSIPSAVGAAHEFEGTFPKEVFQLSSLQSIDLSHNEGLHGSLPEFPNNGSLQNLDLSVTSFSGSLPDSIGNLKMLSTIYIHDNNFTGSIPISMTNLTHLRFLEMYVNNFEGSIPSFSGAKNLEGIDLSSNGLTGNINCTYWGNLTKLSYIALGDNMLNGNIPSSLLSLPLLRNLDLSWNQFFGQFPETSNLSSYFIKDLDLSINNLEGPIPMSIFNLQGLRTLDLSSNNFSGSFSLDSLQHLRNLYFLDLSHNSLFLSHGATNYSYSSFPQFQDLRLASGKLRTFPDFLRNQFKLEVLYLSDNQIQGKIPNWIWRFNNLFDLNLSCNSLETLEGPTINLTSMAFLDLHSNQLHGKIPISSSPNMYYLDYSRNNFSSTIPTSIADLLPNTRFFSISSNNLQGIIPGSICNSHNLEVLDLSNNSLSGTVPHCLTTLSTLSVLNLRRNNLTNVDRLSHNCSLRTLDISENHIQGQLPKSLVNCPQLEVLNLGKNQITGPFPCFLKNTSTLRVLVLRSNKLYGGIGCPKIKGTWPMLQIIDLAHNNFSGNVPGRDLTTWQGMMTNEDVASSELNHLQFQDNGTGGIYYQDTITVTNKGIEMELVKILTVFTSIDFSCNKFTGSIPEEIGELKSLLVLNLSNNAFTGAIPPSMSNLSELESLDLSQNTLSGQIPPQLTKLTFLSFLNLSYNQMVGRIPSSNQFSTFPKSSFEGNKDLFGPPLTEDNTTRFSPPASIKSHRDEIDWNLITVEVGFTCGFGIAIGSLLFCKKWRKWYYRAMYNILLKIFPQLEERFGDHRRHVCLSQRYWRR